MNKFLKNLIYFVDTLVTNSLIFEIFATFKGGNLGNLKLLLFTKLFKYSVQNRDLFFSYFPFSNGNEKCKQIKKTKISNFFTVTYLLSNNNVFIVRYIISAETGNILIWLRLTQQVIFKEEQPGVKQLTLMDNGTKILSISKPTNAPGTDCVRTMATACVREIPST